MPEVNEQEVVLENTTENQDIDTRPALNVVDVEAKWNLKKPFPFKSTAEATPFIGKQVVIVRGSYKEEFAELKYVGANDVIVGDGYTLSFSQVSGWEGTEEEKAYHTAFENA